MSDLPEGTGLLGTLVAALATIAGGFVLLRNKLSSDSVGRAGDAGLLQIIEMLRAQVDMERKRADDATTARDSAVEQITQLRIQVAQLSAQVSSLQKQIGASGITTT